MQQKETWVVVANSSTARIFRFEKRALVQICSFEHPESRLKNVDLVSSDPGRNFQKGGVTRHRYEPKTSPKDNEIELFAREIADHLSRGLDRGSFGKIFLVANPTFHGHLRHYLDEQIKKIIEREIEKDWTHFDAEQIYEQLHTL